MEKLKLTFNLFVKAFTTLKEILEEQENPIVRDAAIQRFEYTFETTWKLLKVYLYVIEGIDCGSPKSCFRQGLTLELLTEEEVELALKMCDDRNLTSHTYIEAIALQIYYRLPQYVLLLDKIKNKISDRID